MKRLETAVQRLRDGMSTFLSGCERARARFDEKQLALTMAAGVLADEIKAAVAAATKAPPPIAVAPPAPPKAFSNLSRTAAEGRPLPSGPERGRAGAPAASPSIGKLHRRILAALGKAVGRPLTRAQLGVKTVTRADTGHFGNCLADLRGAGLIVASHDGFRLTEEGAESPPDDDLRDDLVTEWGRKLGSLERDIFGHLVAHYPEALHRSQLGELTGKRADTGHFGNCLSALRSNGIAEADHSGFTASKDLFE